MVSEPTKNLVLRLRAIREDLGLTIPELMAQTGLSESTVRRVFTDDIDSVSGFNYEGTLMPLCDLLLPKGDTNDSDLSQARIDGLLAVIEIKNQMIEDLTKQFEEARVRQADRCKKCEKDMDFLRKQIDLKDARMDKKDEWIDRLLGHIEEMLHKQE